MSQREVVGRKEIRDLPAPSVTQKVINFETSQPQENNEALNSNVSSQPSTDSRFIYIKRFQVTHTNIYIYI